ncbi:MAG: ATP-dependent Clp protease proteolytic subunit [Waddliaceae bacterium]
MSKSLKLAREKEESPFIKIEDRIDAALLEARRILISDQVDNDSAKDIIRKLWYLELTKPGEPILFVINSPGGSVDDGFAIWDQVRMLTSPVRTLITGLAASMGSILSLCAEKGNRFATRQARVMIHQPMIGGIIQGQATDLDIQAKEMIKTRKKIVLVYTEATGKDYETVDRAIDRDTWMTADEAKAWGLIDDVVDSFQALPQ